MAGHGPAWYGEAWHTLPGAFNPHSLSALASPYPSLFPLPPPQDCNPRSTWAEYPVFDAFAFLQLTSLANLAGLGRPERDSAGFLLGDSPQQQVLQQRVANLALKPTLVFLLPTPGAPGVDGPEGRHGQAARCTHVQLISSPNNPFALASGQRASRSARAS